LPPQLIQFRITHLFVATLAVALLVTTSMACKSVYETHGELASYFYPGVLGLLGIVVLFCLPFQRLRLPALATIFVIYGAFCFRQSILVQRLRDLKVEVIRINSFVEQYKVENGQYPKDLSGYKFERPDLTQFIAYYPDDVGSSSLFDSYWIRFHPCQDEWLFPFHGLGIYHAYSHGGFWFADD
jgi:hypothetical protein